MLQIQLFTLTQYAFKLQYPCPLVPPQHSCFLWQHAEKRLHHQRGPGTSLWHHPENAICSVTKPTHCLDCAICYRKKHQHKPLRGPARYLHLKLQPHILHRLNLKMLGCLFPVDTVMSCALMDASGVLHESCLFKWEKVRQPRSEMFPSRVFPCSIRVGCGPRLPQAPVYPREGCNEALLINQAATLPIPPSCFAITLWTLGTLNTTDERYEREVCRKNSLDWNVLKSFRISLLKTTANCFTLKCKSELYMNKHTLTDLWNEIHTTQNLNTGFLQPLAEVSLCLRASQIKRITSGHVVGVKKWCVTAAH